VAILDKGRKNIAPQPNRFIRVSPDVAGLLHEACAAADSILYGANRGTGSNITGLTTVDFRGPGGGGDFT
jgi:hypothetical protein